MTVPKVRGGIMTAALKDVQIIERTTCGEIIKVTTSPCHMV